ncbi:uncharacterized protein BJ171DRAFT_528074, partial [Polychytrium aggregatum]|uniref:uncharacterized protein n=1 Tax=Polychytrium aggregatum TaxID=110093 RepID=UPI0022FE4D5F
MSSSNSPFFWRWGRRSSHNIQPSESPSLTCPPASDAPSAPSQNAASERSPEVPLQHPNRPLRLDTSSASEHGNLASPPMHGSPSRSSTASTPSTPSGGLLQSVRTIFRRLVPRHHSSETNEPHSLPHNTVESPMSPALPLHKPDALTHASETPTLIDADSLPPNTLAPASRHAAMASSSGSQSTWIQQSLPTPANTTPVRIETPLLSTRVPPTPVESTPPATSNAALEDHMDVDPCAGSAPDTTMIVASPSASPFHESGPPPIPIPSDPAGSSASEADPVRVARSFEETEHVVDVSATSSDRPLETILPTPTESAHVERLSGSSSDTARHSNRYSLVPQSPIRVPSEAPSSPSAALLPAFTNQVPPSFTNASPTLSMEPVNASAPLSAPPRLSRASAPSPQPSQLSDMPLESPVEPAPLPYSSVFPSGPTDPLLSATTLSDATQTSAQAPTTSSVASDRSSGSHLPPGASLGALLRALIEAQQGRIGGHPATSGSERAPTPSSMNSSQGLESPASENSADPGMGYAFTIVLVSDRPPTAMNETDSQEPSDPLHNLMNASPSQPLDATEAGPNAGLPPLPFLFPFLARPAPGSPAAGPQTQSQSSAPPGAARPPTPAPQPSGGSEDPRSERPERQNESDEASQRRRNQLAAMAMMAMFGQFLGAIRPPTPLGDENGAVDGYEALLRLGELIGPARARNAQREDVDEQLTVFKYRKNPVGGDKTAIDAVSPIEITANAMQLDSSVVVSESAEIKGVERDGSSAGSSTGTKPEPSATDLLASTLDKCTICLCPYEEGDELRVMKCKHGFHKDCIDHWLTSYVNSCPICRSAGVEPRPHQDPQDASDSNRRPPHPSASTGPHMHDDRPGAAAGQGEPGGAARPIRPTLVAIIRTRPPFPMPPPSQSSNAGPTRSGASTNDSGATGGARQDGDNDERPAFSLLDLLRPRPPPSPSTSRTPDGAAQQSSSARLGSWRANPSSDGADNQSAPPQSRRRSNSIGALLNRGTPSDSRPLSSLFPLPPFGAYGGPPATSAAPASRPRLPSDGDSPNISQALGELLDQHLEEAMGLARSRLRSSASRSQANSETGPSSQRPESRGSTSESESDRRSYRRHPARYDREYTFDSDEEDWFGLHGGTDILLGPSQGFAFSGHEQPQPQPANDDNDAQLPADSRRLDNVDLGSSNPDFARSASNSVLIRRRGDDDEDGDNDQDGTD